MGQVATQRLVGGDAAHREAAAVKVEQDWQGLRQVLWLWRVQAHRNGVTITGHEHVVFHPCQGVRRNVQHTGTRFVKRLGLGRAQGVHRRVTGPRHAVEHTAHDGQQQALRVAGVVHGCKPPQGSKSSRKVLRVWVKTSASTAPRRLASRLLSTVRS